MPARGESSKGPKQNGTEGKGKGKSKGGNKPLVKTNQAKRDRINSELKELQTKIDNYVSIESCFNTDETLTRKVAPSEITEFKQLPLSQPTLRGEQLLTAVHEADW